jgi:hypothetical protein
VALGVMLACALGAVQAQEALRPEVGKPLQAAQELIKGGHFKEALAKVHDADAVGGKTPSETLMIERMRLAAASGAGDVDTAARSFETINASSKVASADKVRMIESIAGSYYRAHDYAHALQWYQRYFREGGTNPANRTLMIQTQYLSGDFAGATKELLGEIQAAEKSGTAPAEDRINLLMNAAAKQKDVNAETYALERLVIYYPKKEYWVSLLNGLQRKPSFSDRLALDTYRLSLATGSMSAANDYSEMAQLALQAGTPAEAQQVIDKGFAAGALGSGPEADRHKRLRDLVAKRNAQALQTQAEDERTALAAHDGNDLVTIGLNRVFEGQKPQGVLLVLQGIAKGGLKRPEDAKLHLAIAQILAGDLTKAQATLKSVSGTDGTADLARLWALYARRAKTS